MVTDHRLTAATVLAGTSVPWAGADVLTGVVTARSGDRLTVRGVDCNHADGSHAFFNSATVLVGDGTDVTALGVDAGTLDKDSISVGQRIVAFGQLTDAATLDAATLDAVALDAVVLDASAGHVRMEVTELGGVVVQAHPLVVHLFALGGLRPLAFDFSGTGKSSMTNADPLRYEIDTATLGLPAVAPNDVVRVRGLVNAFGAAPPDFLARTVIDVDTLATGALFWAGWWQQGGTAAPFTGVSANRIDVDLTDARHALKLFDFDPNPAAQPDQIALVAPSGGRGMYLVAVRGAREVHAFGDFASLTAELSRQLAAGHLLAQMAAAGRYNAAAIELTTPQASFEFTTP